MKIEIPCMECLRIDRAPNPKFQTLEYNDSGIYSVVCDKGHSTKTVLQEQKFEVLSNIGAFALQDGYYRETVATFSACLERFYEFFLRVSFGEGKAFDDAWRRVASQSERQLGAFIFVWMKEFGEPPTPLPRTRYDFRNDVIHKGVLPSRSEATSFAAEVYELIRSYVRVLMTERRADVLRYVGTQAAKNSEGTSGQTIATLLSLNSKMKDFDEALAGLYEIYQFRKLPPSYPRKITISEGNRNRS